MNELNIGEIIIENEIDIGNFELDVIKELPNYESLEITPTTEEQIKEGSFNKVTVAGDTNLLPENISKGTSIFGVEGTAQTTDLQINNFNYFFYYGNRIEQLDKFLKLSNKPTSCKYMFADANNLTELNLEMDSSETTDMSYMFDNCRSLNSLILENLNTAKVEDMSYMFGKCQKLTSLDLTSFDTTNVTKMTSMFSSCYKLESINVSSFDTRNVTAISYMFSGCSGLTDLDLSNFDLSSVTYVNNMFSVMNKLTNLKSFKNLGKGYTTKTQNNSSYKLDLSSSTKLTHESLMDIINNLYDLNLTYNVANGGTLYRQQLVLGSTNLAKLTEEEIAIATNKGWNVS